MTGILASSSAFRMHSSKNPAAAVPLRPSRPAPRPRAPAGKPRSRPPARAGHRNPRRAPTQVQEPEKPSPDAPAAGVCRRGSLRSSGPPNAHPNPRRAPGQGPGSAGSGLPRGLSASAGGWRRGPGLTFQMAHVSPHPLLLLLVPHLGVEPLFQAPQGPLCLPQTPLQIHADFYLGLGEGGRDRRKWGPGEQLSSPVEAFPGHPLVQAGFLVSGLGWKLPHPASCLEPLTGWPGPSPCTRQGSSSAPPPRQRAHCFPKWWLHRLPLAGETGRDNSGLCPVRGVKEGP